MNFEAQEKREGLCNPNKYLAAWVSEKGDCESIEVDELLILVDLRAWGRSGIKL